MNDKANIHKTTITSLLPKEASISVNFEDWRQFRFDVLGPDGIMFFQFLVFKCATVDPKFDGWYYHSKDKIKEELGINRERLDRIIKTMEEIGVLEKERRGVPYRLYYRIKFEELTKPKTLDEIYRIDSERQPQRYRQLGELFERCIPKPISKEQIRKDERDNERAERLIAILCGKFYDRRESYSNSSRETGKTRVLHAMTLPVKTGHRNAAKKILNHFSEQQIIDGFTPYCDFINFTNGGIPQSSAMPNLDIMLPKKDILSYFLSNKREFEVFRSCLNSSLCEYGSRPTPPAPPPVPFSSEYPPGDPDELLF